MTAQIQLFGRFYVAPNVLALPTLTRPRQQAFLAYLLLECHKPQARQTIATTFWPESSEVQASKNLRVLLVELRQVWPAFDQAVQIERTTLQWRPQHPVTVDVVEFANLLAQAKRAAQQQASEQHLSALRHATALYSGDLLPHLFDEWVEQARRRLAEQFKTALAELAQLQQARGCFADAIQSAQRLQQVDPLSEQACRLLLTCYPLLGEKALALQAYQSYENALHHELGIEPEADLQASYLELLRAQSVLQQASHRYLSPKAEPAPMLVGRANEWTQLTTLWRTAHPGVPRFVLLTGEAGIGKTQLAEQFLHWVQGQGAVVAAAKCYAFGGSSGEEALSYAPIVTWLRSSELARHLSRLNERWLTELLRILPEIHSTHPTLPLPEAMRHGLQRSQFFEALTHAMCASGRPLLLFIDDLQWCDRETLDWLLYLLLQFPLTTPLLIIGALRSGEVTEQHPYHPWRAQLRYHQRWQEVRLPRLDATATKLMMQEVATQAGINSLLSPDFSAALYRYTAGNPLFILETLRTLSADLPSEHSPAWLQTWQNALAAGLLPAKVQAMIEQRLTTLSPEAQALSAIAAVIGTSFTIAILRIASSLTEEQLTHNLEELLQRQIVREGDGETYDFSHDLIREAAYVRLSQTRRRFLHRSVGQAIATVYADHVTTVNGRLAFHAMQAGQYANAVVYYQQAAATDRRLHANRAAITQYRQALDLYDQLPPTATYLQQKLQLLVELGAALIDAEGKASPDVEQVYLQAYTLSQQIKDGAQTLPVLYALVAYYYGCATYEKAYTIAQQLLVLAQSQQDHYYLMVAYFQLGATDHVCGRLTLARSHLGQALSCYSVTYSYPRLYNEFAHLLWLLGYPEQALRLCEEAYAYVQTSTRPYDKVELAADRLELRLLIMTCHSPLKDEISTDSAALIALADKYEFAQWLSWVAYLHGWQQAQQGKMAGVLQMQKGVDGYRATGGLSGCTKYLIWLAAMSLQLDEVTQAHAYLDEAALLLQQTGECFWKAELYRLQGECLLRQGQHQAEVAEKWFQRSLAIARQQKAKSLELRTVMSLCRLWQDQGQGAVAKALLTEVYDWFTEGFALPDLQAAKRLLES